MALSSPDYAHLPPLEEEDRIFSINKKIFDVLPCTLEKVALWGSNKLLSQNFLDFLQNGRKIPNKMLVEVFSQNDMHKLDKFNFQGLDITFICPLLTLMCDNIAEVGSDDWKTRITDETKVECQINKIRELRNAVMHYPHGKAIDKTLSDEMEVIILKLLENARMMYMISPEIADQAKSEVKESIAGIKKQALTKEEKIFLLYRKLFIKEGMQMLRDDNDKFIDQSPLAQHIRGFYDLNLAIEEKVIPSSKLLRFCDESPNNRIMFIEGHSGSGKSTLVKQIRADILQKDGKPRIFEGSEAFQIPLFLSCRTVNCKTMPQLFRLLFGRVAQKLRGEELIEESIGQMKNLMLIDGLDELSEDSKTLVEGGIVPFLKNHAETTCIFTSRPHSVQSFEARLRQEGLSFKTLKIEELKTKTEQIEFLNTAFVGGPDIPTSYVISKLDLRFPVLLGLYSFLHNRDSNSVKLLPTSSHLMREAIEYGLRDATKRLDQYGVKDCEIVAANILQKIAFISLSCLLLVKLSLKQPEIKWLIAECRKEYSGLNVKTVDILSCFFPAVAFLAFGTVSNYCDYFHKSHQETLASIYVYKQMMVTARSVQEICIEAIKLYRNINLKVKERNFKVRAFLKQ